MKSAAVITLAACAIVGLTSLSRQIQPKLEGVQPIISLARLTVGGQTLEPLKTDTDYFDEREIGGALLAFKLDSIEGTSPKEDWRINAPANASPFYMAHDDTSFYYGLRPRKREDLYDFVGPDEIHIVETKTGTSLGTIKPQGVDEGAYGAFITVIANNKWTITLNSVVVKDPDTFSGSRTTAYVVSCFPHGSTKLAWSKRRNPNGERQAGQGFLMASAYPNYADDAVTPLQWIGNDVLLCPGPMEPIERLSTTDGESKWSLDHLWEFQRGFIGPSVWSHFIGRFGGDHYFGEEKVDPEMRKKFDEKFNGALVAGPAVIEIDGRVSPGYEPDGRYFRMFFAVSLAEADEAWAGYVSNIILYEIAGTGEIVSMATIPRLPLGSNTRSVGESIVWVCQNNALMRVSKSDSTGFGSGPGGPDCISKISWYRELDEYKPEVWLASGPAGDPVSFSERYCFRQAGGGYVQSADEKQISFPVYAIELGSGDSQRMTLTVPLTEALKLPSTNYSSNGKTVTAIGPYQVGLTWMAVVGHRLRVVLATEQQRYCAEYSLSDIEDALERN